MKISIITSVYNNQETIHEAIKSVLSQTYSNIEYIIIDAASEDSTTDIIRSYGKKITIFTSEHDSGIYDGLNKGITAATGDVIGFLHGDDLYANSDVISHVADAFSDGNIDAVYGDLVYISKSDTSKILRYWKSCEFNNRLLSRGWMPAHPTFFIKKSLYEKYGFFDTTYQIAADYDFMLRILSKNIHTKYLPFVMYKMRTGGKSNKNLRNIIRKMQEDHRALKRNNIGGIWSLMIKNLSKISQFFIK